MSNIKKLCGFCINEWHLTTMVLPYISKEINNNYKIEFPKFLKLTEYKIINKKIKFKK